MYNKQHPLTSYFRTVLEQKVALFLPPWISS